MPETGYRVTFTKKELENEPTKPVIVGIVVYVPEGQLENGADLRRIFNELQPEAMKTLGPCGTMAIQIAELPENEEAPYETIAEV